MSRKIATGVMIGIMVFLLTACSEKEYGSLSCPGANFESVDTLRVHPRLEFQQVTVTADDSGLPGMSSLYLGSDGDTESMILVNFDFSSVINEDFPAEMFTVDNIRNVKLRLIRYVPYQTRVTYVDSVPTNENGTGINYIVFPQPGPFVPEDYEYWPGSRPVTDVAAANDNFLETSYSSEPSMLIDKSTLLSWVQNGESVGLAIVAHAGSEPGLVGFASNEWFYANELPTLSAVTFPGPVLIIDFGTSDPLIIPSTDDTSTFHQIEAMSPEHLQVQTGLRSYPVLTYDLPSLSDGTCVLNFGFQVTPVAMTRLWSRPCLTVTLVDSTRADWSSGSVSADVLYGASLVVMQGCVPETSPNTLKFFGREADKGGSYGLPSVVHMMLNFYDSTATFSNNQWRYDRRYHPEMYFSQSTLYGPSASPADRPVLLLLTAQSQE